MVFELQGFFCDLHVNLTYASVEFHMQYKLFFPLKIIISSEKPILLIFL